MSVIAIILLGVSLYVAIGLVTAVAFITTGLKQVLPPATPVTIPARILFIPGATILWPCVLRRWTRSDRRR